MKFTAALLIEIVEVDDKHIQNSVYIRLFLSECTVYIFCHEKYIECISCLIN